MSYSYAWKDVFSPGTAKDFFETDHLRPFEVLASQFSRTNAWWLSELSRLIYVRGDNETDRDHQTACRNHFLHKVGLKERCFYNGKYVQCAVIGREPGSGQEFSVLVFRGTRGKISNWFFNLSATLSPWSAGGLVHKGFNLLFMEAWEEIETQLTSVSGPVYYTGHSLGGALAVLAASLRKPAAVYTFGSPRMGDGEFVQATEHLKIYRVVNPRDIVTVVPPIPGIEHVGEPHYLTCEKAVLSQRSWFEAPGFLADHSPSNYSIQL